MEITMKRCYKCKQEKDESSFNKDKNRKDGLSPICKECKHKYYLSVKNNEDYKEKRRQAVELYRKRHPQRVLEQQRKYEKKRKRNKEADRLSFKKLYHKRRRKIIKYYGDVCICCGEDNYKFLTLDHIDGNGNEHRRKVGSGMGMLRWIIQNDYPPIFQVLCWNCNSAKGVYGECPHEEN